MVEARLYKEGDLSLGDWEGDPPRSFEFICRTGAALSLWSDDSIIAIFVASPMWDKVWSVSLLSSKRVSRHALSLVKELNRAMDTLVDYHNIRKLYTLMDTANEGYTRWIKFLGFSEEYVMKNAGPNGQDMAGYSKIMEES